MSLAYSAAEFNEGSNTSFIQQKSNNILNQKRHKKTQKLYPIQENFDTNKVKNVLQNIHNKSNDDDDDDDIGKYYYEPPPKPESSGVQKTSQVTETFNGMNVPFSNMPEPSNNTSEITDLNNYTNNYGNNKSNEEYLNKIYGEQNKQYNPSNKPYYKYREKRHTDNYDNNSDILMKKLNYIITLLEEQQDEKTNNVTEEVILYSFLGIFIIFIADTFVKSGKYTR